MKANSEIYKSIILRAAAVLLCVIMMTAGIKTQTYAEDDTFGIDYTDGTPVLDGTAEDLWKDAAILEFGDTVKGRLRIMWNEYFIFIFCEVTDDKVCSSESLDKDNDCLEIILLTDHSGSEYSFGNTDTNDPSKGNYDFLIYNEYKEEAFGKTINNDLRDYVVAERCETEDGYNLEALIKLQRRVLPGDEFLFNCILYDIDEENGPVTNTEALREEGFIRLAAQDPGYKYDDSAYRISFIGLDMKYGYGKEDIETFTEKLEPNVLSFINATDEDVEMIMEIFPYYTQVREKGSAALILADPDVFTVTEQGTAGKGRDCTYCFLREKDGPEAFYVFAFVLDEKYASERRAGASEIRSDIGVINNNGFPVLVFCDLNAGDGSYSYDIFGRNYMDDLIKTAEDSVSGTPGTLRTFISKDEFAVNVFRTLSKPGQEKETYGGFYMLMNTTGTPDTNAARRRNIFYILEGAATVALGGLLAVYLLRKSRKKDRPDA